MVEPSWTLVAAAAVLAATLALWLWARWRRFVGSRRATIRSARALAGESDAEPLLVAEGYRIVARQVPLTWAVYRGGDVLDVLLRADLLVERDGRLFVAEVKTGERAPCLSHAATRRQLLEYFHAFDCDGVLLVDVEGGEIHEIAFAPPAAPRLDRFQVELIESGAEIFVEGKARSARNTGRIRALSNAAIGEKSKPDTIKMT